MAIKHLEGKVAIVTGGAGGIGSHISRIFAQQGARVVVADTGADVEGQSGTDPARVQAVVEDIRRQGGEAISLVADVSDWPTGEKLVRAAVETYGQLDALVCAHGVLRERMLFNMLEDEWDGVVQAHLKGCIVPTKFAARYWRETRRGGRIVYFTSSAALFGATGQGNYATAHAGKLGLMRSVAKALAPYGVTCSAISPLASTRMTDRGRAQAQGERPASATAAGTAVDPMNVVPIIVYLCSDRGASVSGRIFGATGHRVSLWAEAEPDSSIFWPDPPWEVGKLREVFPSSLGFEGFAIPQQRQ